MTLPVRKQYAAYCKAWGDAARERGKANEDRLLTTVLSLRATSTWILDARAATPEEDASGVDVVVSSDVGALHLQSKSSRAGQRKFTGKARSVRVETVVVALDDTTTATRALLALSALRAERQRPVTRPVVVEVSVVQKAPKLPKPLTAQQVAKTERRRAHEEAAARDRARKAARQIEHRLANPRDTQPVGHPPPAPLPIDEQLRRAEARRASRYAVGYRCGNSSFCERIVDVATAWLRVDDKALLCAECAGQMDRDWQDLGRPVSARAAGRLLAIVGGGV